jgi:hypothetical protein
MRIRLGILAVLATMLVTGLTIAPTAGAANAPTQGAAAVPLQLTGVTCTLLGTTTTAPCTVTATLQGFTAQGGQLFAQVLVTVSNGVDTASQLVLLPVTQATGTCQILHLELGPIDLNLLGLRVQTNRIVLDITAQSGPGNLLGNLLCGVANLLNSSAPATTLANILNRLLGLL